MQDAAQNKKKSNREEMTRSGKFWLKQTKAYVDHIPR